MGAKAKPVEFATKQDVQEIADKVVEDLSDVIQIFATHVDDRFNKLEARVDKLESSFFRLQNTLDAFLKRLDDTEADNHVRDAHFNRLLAWAEKVAEKTGVKLEF